MKSLPLVALLAISLAPIGAHAQVLADAARRAEESRKSAAGPARAFTDKDVSPALGDGQQISGHELTVQNFQAFMSTRRAYVKLLVADAGLRGRMQARLVQAKSIDSAIAAWSGEDAVLALIRDHGTNPREFLLTELAVAQAVMVLKALQREPDPGDIPPIVQRNMAFVKAHWVEIEAFAREIQALASQMP